MNNFKEIPNFKGKYLINAKGVVISTKGNEKKLKPYKDRQGFLNVNLWIKDVNLGLYAYRKKIHRLVAEMFLDNPDNYSRVVFKDEDKTNCKVENLMWSKKNKI